MINIYTDDEIKLIKESGHITYQTHQYLKEFLKPGVTTKHIDDLAGEFIRSKGGVPSCLGFEGYPGNICISINDEVVHGIGSDRKLKEGDIVTLDICTLYKGYHSDSAWTYPVGKINKEKEYLLYHTEKSLFVGLKELKAQKLPHKRPMSPVRPPIIGAPVISLFFITALADVVFSIFTPPACMRDYIFSEPIFLSIYRHQIIFFTTKNPVDKIHRIFEYILT